MATDKPRFTITLDPALLDRVLDYKDKNHLSTQSKAIQKLVELGIKDMKQSSPVPALILSEDEQELITKYQQLTDLNKGRVLQQIDTLLDGQKQDAVKSIESVG